MKLSAFLAIVGIVATLFGIGFVVAPAQVLAQYGITADHYTIFMSRFFGAALINLGLLVWLARNVVDVLARKAIVLASLVADVIGFIVALRGQMQGVANALGWSTVAIYGLFALGFGYFQFAPKRPTA
jgi:uncharacterized membrane protein YfcA